MIPGEIIPLDRDLVLNEGRRCVTVTTANKGDRPIQVGSHFHFYEVNRALSFDRQAAFGMRLDIPSGTAVRFEPGETKTVNLVEIRGKKKYYGFNGLAAGAGVEEAAGRLEKWLTE
ncbi:MAG: urease subunit beta [Treponema sp.]|jgi:urease beta subunit|nr:urease subunit beta [Treponema sp.]